MIFCPLCDKPNDFMAISHCTCPVEKKWEALAQRGADDVIAWVNAQAAAGNMPHKVGFPVGEVLGDSATVEVAIDTSMSRSDYMIRMGNRMHSFSNDVAIELRKRGRLRIAVLQ